uniref:J domain-containing protein n=1 Tax=viral metagenome TaxID=1070528 RepID=A0A6C0D569_9ZZZZ
MGNIQSVDPSHIRIFENLQKIQNPATKIQMIQTILAGPEYVISAKKAGIYADLLNYVARNTNAQQYQQQYQQPQPKHQQQEVSHQIVQPKEKRSHIQRLEKANSDEKAIGYFQACLQMLNLEEEVALTEDILKSAYKKSVLKHHPDKGGSEKEFEKVTRAYAYLGEILRRIHGGRSTTVNVDAPNVLKDSRAKEYDTVKHVEPIKLNPKKLDLNAFNKMFEQTRIPDPEEDGYGDWLGSQKEESSSQKFSGKFNRDVFNQAFEEEAKESAKQKNYIIHQPQSMIMAPTLGVELGRERPDSYTAAYNADLNFTDLKQAYTVENTFSKQVANVRVDNRNFESYKNDYTKAPAPLSSDEMSKIQEGEQYMQKREEQRRRRAAEEEIGIQRYFDRMKQLVLTDNTKS